MGKKGKTKMSEVREKKRSSNFELLRILCMCLIVMHHFTVHGGAIAMEGLTNNRIISLIILPLGKICFNCFVALSTWFLASSTFKSSRFVKIWCQVLFYNIVFLGLASIMGQEYIEPLSWKTWLGSLFPIIGNSHGYAAAYMAFYLSLPFLKLISDAVNKKQLLCLIFILVMTQLAPGLLGNLIGYVQPFISEILLFVMCYFISVYLQRYPKGWQTNKWLLCGVFVFSWLLTAFFRILNVMIPELWFPSFFINWVTGSEFSIINIAAGYALFLLFNMIKMPYNRVINGIASTVFGVLLAHDHNYFRSVLWQGIFRTSQWYYIPTIEFIGRMVLITVIIMVVGGASDFLRQKLLEKPIMKTRLTLSICNFIDNWFSNSSPKERDNEF